MKLYRLYRLYRQQQRADERDVGGWNTCVVRLPMIGSVDYHAENAGRARKNARFRETR